LLTADPNLEQCPDFTSPSLQDSCLPLLSTSVDDAQAADILRASWLATNAAYKRQWQLQLDAATHKTTEHERLLAEAEAQRCATQDVQDAALLDKDRKKNHIHHIPIPDRPRPSRAAETFIVSDFALRKLDKAQFIELYYWTNKGLADARLDFKTVDDDSMVPTIGVDGSTVWTAASAARPSTGVITDHLLQPLDFSKAVPHYIDSLEQRGWAAPQVTGPLTIY
ncbi:hypothetical protein C8R48DRAFT_604753, partial [Suillus tomentosus]